MCHFWFLVSSIRPCSYGDPIWALLAICLFVCQWLGDHSTSSQLTSPAAMCSLPPFLYFLQLRTLGTCAQPRSPDAEEKARLAYYEYLANLSEARRHRVRSAHSASVTRVSVTSATIRGNLCPIFCRQSNQHENVHTRLT